MGIGYSATVFQINRERVVGDRYVHDPSRHNLGRTRHIHFLTTPSCSRTRAEGAKCKSLGQRPRNEYSSNTQALKARNNESEQTRCPSLYLQFSFTWFSAQRTASHSSRNQSKQNCIRTLPQSSEILNRRRLRLMERRIMSTSCLLWDA